MRLARVRVRARLRLGLGCKLGLRRRLGLRLRARFGGGPTGLQEGGLPFVLEGRAALDDGLAVREEVDLVHQGDELLVGVGVGVGVRVRVRVRVRSHSSTRVTNSCAA